MPAAFKVAYILRCPVVKFIGSMVSYMTFLILITVATFRLDTKVLTDEDDNWRARSMEIWSYDFRTSNLVMTKIQIILLFWILGNLAMAAKQVYHSGLRYIFRSYYNVMDWASLVIYLASYSLRIIVDFKVQSALTIYQDELRIAQGLLDNATCASTRLCPNTFPSTHNDYVAYRNHILTSPAAYWLRGCRLWWAPDDPEYVSDCLFALGNVLSFARISHLMPAWELLGPLQISLARMISDIIRFMTLFVLMMTAFVVGLTNLYWYFSNIIVSVDLQGHLVRYASGIPAFRSTGATFYTLYWALFGQSSNNVTTVDDELAQRYPGHESLAVASSPAIINNLGSILYATYNACMIIILLNMLIAMMSKSFDEIQGDKLEEWKFARASLWMVYIDQEGVLPVPLNLLPSREALGSLCERLKRTVVPKRSTLYTEQNRKIQRSRQNLRNTVWANDFPQDNCDDFAMAPHTKMKKTITVSTTLDTSPVHVNNWISDDSEIDSVQEKPEDEFREYTDITRTNVLRRFLFKLQEQRELQSKGTDLSIMNYQRQQKTEEKDALQTRGSVMSRRESKGVHQEDAGSTGSHEHEDTNEDRLRGLSSLLMPPSVRKKLEAVAAASSQINDDEGREAAEAVARYYLLETTRKNKDHEEGEPTKGVFNRKKKMSTGSWKSRASIEEPFTARTERPVKGAHLRELYKVEQEMHDMSEALSSQSLSEATISEINELERI
ncbi:unnamed protein product [Calicophoron daubneyi]|uniref:Ion transport domain-containing protein n=1 Tax=Calicophoron daubneyi TaxID=300641 RepID=A0AAV2TNQ5_CALDB